MKEKAKQSKDAYFLSQNQWEKLKWKKNLENEQTEMMITEWTGVITLN